MAERPVGPPVTNAVGNTLGRPRPVHDRVTRVEAVPFVAAVGEHGNVKSRVRANVMMGSWQ